MIILGFIFDDYTEDGEYRDFHNGAKILTYVSFISMLALSFIVVLRDVFTNRLMNQSSKRIHKGRHTPSGQSGCKSGARHSAAIPRPHPNSNLNPNTNTNRTLKCPNSTPHQHTNTRQVPPDRPSTETHGRAGRRSTANRSTTRPRTRRLTSVVRSAGRVAQEGGSRSTLIWRATELAPTRRPTGMMGLGATMRRRAVPSCYS